MKAIVFLILFYVSGNSYGETTEAATPSVKHAQFNITLMHVQQKKETICKSTPNVISVKEGQRVEIGTYLPSPHRVHEVSCLSTKNSKNATNTSRLDVYIKKEQSYDTLVKEDIKELYFGSWSCKFNYNTIEDLQVDEQDLTPVYCDLMVKKELPSPDEHKPLDIKTIYGIAGGVGVIVALIIIGQTIALCYFRRKAIPQRRMDKLTIRSRSDSSGQARYSSPPCRKNSKSTARAQADTDSHIYEMVGINALYNGSHIFSTESKNEPENAIKNRPPLPLPHELPEPPPPIETLPRRKPSPIQSMASTLSLNSISSTSTLTSKKKGKEPPGVAAKKVPARPPKPEDLPGSLKRAPKTTAVTAKTGSIPKMHATDPTMVELKNAMRLRNITTDSPSSSPTTTLEKKPKVQAKPNKKQKKEHAQDSTQKQHSGTNQPNQIKLILPKIEASLKPVPKPVPKPIQDTVKPNPAPVVKKPMSQNPIPHVPQNKPLPVPAPMANKTPSHMNPVMSQTSILNRPLPVTSHTASHTNPALHSNPASQSQPTSQIRQNRPLPAPTPYMPSHMIASQVSPLNRPLPTPHVPPVTSRPLPPDPEPEIYNAPEEDLSRDEDDEEEWTYEQLGKYNIYNI